MLLVAVFCMVEGGANRGAAEMAKVVKKQYAKNMNFR